MAADVGVVVHWGGRVTTLTTGSSDEARDDGNGDGLSRYGEARKR